MKTEKKDCCKECGFPVDMPRKPVFITKNFVDLIKFKSGECKTCGHQKNGWSITTIQEHFAKLIQRNFVSKKKIRERIEELKTNDTLYCTACPIDELLNLIGEPVNITGIVCKEELQDKEGKK